MIDDFDSPNIAPGTCPDCGQKANIWDAMKQQIERKTLEYRIRTGWDAEKALTTPSLIPRKK